MSITITSMGNRLHVATPYHPSFAGRAKEIGGRWNAADKTWSFDTRDDARVRDLCRSIFGTDGSPTTLVTLRVDMSAYKSDDECWIAGRLIAKRGARDYAVKLGDDCVLVAGRFPRSSGSRSSPDLGENDAVIEVRDVPLAAAEAAIAHNNQLPDDPARVWIPPSNSPTWAQWAPWPGLEARVDGYRIPRHWAIEKPRLWGIITIAPDPEAAAPVVSPELEGAFAIVKHALLDGSMPATMLDDLREAMAISLAPALQKVS